MGDIRSTFENNFASVTSEQRVSMEDIVKLNTQSNDIEISNEGLIDGVSNFFGDIKRNFKHGKRVKLVTGHRQNKLDKNLNIIELTYQNPAWLDKRRFVEGDVKANDIARNLVRGVRGDVDINSALVSEIIAYVDKYAKEYEKVLKQYITRIKPLAEKVRRGPLTGELYSDVQEFIQEPKNRNILSSVVDHKFVFPLANTSFVNGELDYKTTYAPTKLPALTSEQVVKVTGYIKEILEYIDKTSTAAWDIVNNTFELTFIYDHNWSGWKEIEVLRDGKYGSGAILKSVGSDDSYSTLTRIAATVGGDVVSDEVLADRWTDALDSFDAYKVNQMHVLLQPLTNVANSLALWVDRSVR